MSISETNSPADCAAFVRAHSAIAALDAGPKFRIGQSCEEACMIALAPLARRRRLEVDAQSELRSVDLSIH